MSENVGFLVRVLDRKPSGYYLQTAKSVTERIKRGREGRHTSLGTLYTLVLPEISVYGTQTQDREHPYLFNKLDIDRVKRGVMLSIGTDRESLDDTPFCSIIYIWITNGLRFTRST